MIKFLGVKDFGEVTSLGFNLVKIEDDCAVFWLLYIESVYKDIDYYAYGVLGLVPNHEDVIFDAKTDWLVTPNDPISELPYEVVVDELDEEVRKLVMNVNKGLVATWTAKSIRGKNIPNWR